MAGHRQRRIETLRRRYLHLDARVSALADGEAMYDRQERGALNYALAIIWAARRLDVLDDLEADALAHRAIPVRDASEQAQRAAGVERRTRTA